MTKEKRFKKAVKHLAYWKESLANARNNYIEACRSKNPMMDIKSLYLATENGYDTLREVEKAEAIEDMKYAKERIAHFQRIAL